MLATDQLGIWPLPQLGYVHFLDLDEGTARHYSAVVNSTGSEARIEADGFRNVQSAAFRLRATLVPGDLGLFIYGDSRDDNALGLGRLCVGGNSIYRLPPVAPVAEVPISNVDFGRPPPLRSVVFLALPPFGRTGGTSCRIIQARSVSPIAESA